MLFGPSTTPTSNFSPILLALELSLFLDMLVGAHKDKGNGKEETDCNKIYERPGIEIEGERGQAENFHHDPENKPRKSR